MSGGLTPLTVPLAGAPAIAASLRLTRGRAARPWPRGPRRKAQEQEAA